MADARAGLARRIPDRFVRNPLPIVDHSDDAVDDRVAVGIERQLDDFGGDGLAAVDEREAASMPRRQARVPLRE